VYGTSIWNNARLGIVYRSAEKAPKGASNQRSRCATRAAVKAIAKPMATAIVVSSMC